LGPVAVGVEIGFGMVGLGAVGFAVVDLVVLAAVVVVPAVVALLVLAVAVLALVVLAVAAEAASWPTVAGVAAEATPASVHDANAAMIEAQPVIARLIRRK
jgi:hypothetical protein